MPRVYAVENEQELTMVIADTQSQSLNHVVKGKYKVKAATAIEVAEYVAQGGVIERAGKEDNPPAEDPSGT